MQNLEKDKEQQESTLEEVRRELNVDEQIDTSEVE